MSLIGATWAATVEPFAPRDGAYDVLAGEHYAGVARSASIVVCMQITWDADQVRQPGLGGADQPARGRVAARIQDVRAAGWNPRDGDRITSIRDRCGNVREVNYYLRNLRISGQLATRPALVVGAFEAQSGQRASTPEGLFG